MNKLIELVRERRRRQENPDQVIAIFHTFIDPATKKEAIGMPRQAFVIGGPRLHRKSNESREAFKAKVVSIAHQLREQNEQARGSAR